MRYGTTFSALLHLAVFLIGWLGLPHLFRPLPPEEQPIVVEILTVAEITNAPARQAEPPPRPAPPRPEPPRPEPPRVTLLGWN